MSSEGAYERAGVAWVLNLAAEAELGGGKISAAASRRMDHVRRSLGLPDSHVVIGLGRDEEASGLPGRCWCPTPSALARLAAAGAIVPEAPAEEVLHRVNERGFASDMIALPSARRCERLEEIRAAADRPGRWLLFRALTFAGRGQRRVEGGVDCRYLCRWCLRVSLRG